MCPMTSRFNFVMQNMKTYIEDNLWKMDHFNLQQLVGLFYLLLYICVGVCVLLRDPHMSLFIAKTSCYWWLSDI